MTRQEINKEIINILSQCIDKFPDLRFGQLLENVDCLYVNNSNFYLESIDSLNRMKTKIDFLKKQGHINNEDIQY